MKLIFSICLSVFLWHTSFAQGNVKPTDSLNAELKSILDKHGTPGAVVVWVQDGVPVILKGYGFANLEKEQPINVDKTLFRLASISKPFTAIGVLQKVEKGKLDLDSHINTYFDKPIVKDDFESPVTLRHLLTHTAGFDDRFIGLSSKTRKEAPSLRATMETMLPSRVANAGEFYTYSNYGGALAGYILEHVSRENFATLMESQVFKPLGMMNSSFDPDEKTTKHLVTGYYQDGNIHKPLAFDYINTAPAGQMVSTARDMATFITKILRPGGLAASGVLSEDMTSEMLSVQFKNHSAMSEGTGFLWDIGYLNGHRAISHDGGYMGTTTKLMLFPEHKAGLFIAANIMNSNFIYDATELLVDTFLPKPEASVRTPAQRFIQERPISDFSGTWRNTRYSKNTLSKFFTFLGGDGNELVIGKENDTLLTMPWHAGEARRLIQTGPLLFQSLNDDYNYFLAFRENNGEITHMFTGGSTSWERLNPVETFNIQSPLFAGSLLLLTIIFISCTILFVVRKIRKRQAFPTSLTRYEWSISTIYTGGFLMMVWLTIYQVPLSGFGFVYGVPEGFYISNLLPYLALGVTILLIYKIFRNKEVTTGRKIWSFAVVAISLTYFFCLDYWNLVGWRF